MAQDIDLLALLPYIPASELSYSEWVGVGMALKEAGHSEGDWEDWSRNDSRYRPGECARKWDTFQGCANPVTGGTIVQMAKDRGWRPGSDDGPGYELDWDSIIGSRDGVLVDKGWLEGKEVREPDNWNPVEDLTRYLETLFEASENVGYVTESWERDGRFMPSKGHCDRSAGELIEQLHKYGNVQDVFGDYNPEVGAWIRFNPLDGRGVKNENVTEYRYALVESDSMELEQQHAMIRELELPVACLVYSGGKSIHAIVKIEAGSYDEYRKRVDYLYSVLQKNGMQVDTQNKNPSRLSRMPGVIRKGHKQFLMATNIGKGSFKEWQEWIESMTDDLPNPESLGDVWGDLPELAPPLIEGVLRQGHKMLIAGPSKAGKSYGLIELCCAIAEGKDWLGWHCTQGRVLYVNLELDRASCLHRFKDIYTAMGWKPDNIRNLDIWNLRGKSVPMDKLAPKLIRRASKKNYIAIIIDPIYKIITGDENSADQMAAFCNQFDLVCTELGCAVIYCHHHSKGSQGQKRSMDRASGSGVFARDPDALLDLIELEVTDNVRKSEADQETVKLCRKYLDANAMNWEDDVSQDDACVAHKLLEYCRNRLCKEVYDRLIRDLAVATATPSPNKYKELIHYAGYLEVMDTGQALTRFFQRDSTKANNLTLYPHKEEEFWLWVSSWALFLSKPSDLGYDDTGYDLPPLDVRTHMITSRVGDVVDKDGQVKLMRDAAVSLQDAAKEKRESVADRVSMAKQIVDSDPDSHFLLWHDLEYERETILKEIPGTVDIYGSMDYDQREKRVIDFSEGKTRLFATKKSLSGSGCNFQRHCNRAIFVGIDYEFNDFIQAIHRIYRFLQTKQVIIDVIYTEAEKQIWRVLLEKWENHKKLQKNMSRIVKEYGLLDQIQAERMARSIGVERVEIKGENWTLVNNDCVEEVRRMPSDFVGLIHTSIPFSNHYEYTPSYNDFGHNENTVRFFEQMDYLTPELLRILMPGRVAAIHVKDRVLFGNVTGYGMPSMEPFHAQCIQHYMKHGFVYFGMITVTTDVVRENNQTYRLGWTEQCKDGSKMGVGCPEYVLLFRKLPTDRSKAYADDRIVKSKEEYPLSQWQLDAHAFWRTGGNRNLDPDELARLKMSDRMRRFREFSRAHIYDYDRHVALSYALEQRDAISKEFMTVPPASVHPDVWDDVSRMRTLNTAQSQRRKQLHVCPLQLDIVERVINRYSNADDLVFDPFAGLGTVPMMAVRMGRKGYGCELNSGYFADAVGYLRAEEAKMEQPSLFDLMEQEGF